MISGKHQNILIKTCKNLNDKIRASVALYLEINNYSDSRRYDDALRVDSTVKSWVLAGFIIGLLVVVFYVFVFCNPSQRMSNSDKMILQLCH